MKDEELRDAYTARLGGRDVEPSRAGCVTPDAMLDVVEGRASEDKRIDVVDHAMSCPECRREFETLRAIARAGEQLEGATVVVGTSTAAPRRGWRSPRALVAAAAVVMIAGAGVVLQRRGADERGGAAVAPEPMRGGDAAGLQLVGPAGAVPRAGLALVWHPVAGAARYDAELLDSAGAPRFTRATVDSTVAVPDSVRLSPGAGYRWWVRAQLPDGSERRSEMRAFTVSP